MRRLLLKTLLVAATMSVGGLHQASAQTASLIINEVNPNISSNRDLLELLVLKGGSIEGITVEQAIGNPVVLATLPAVNVSAGDLIIVHNTSVVLGGTGAPGSETLATNEYPSATFSSNYDTAWDVQGGTTGLTFTHRVLLVKSFGVIQDAIPFVLTTAQGNSGFTIDLQNIQAQGLWLPANCAGIPCNYASVPTAQDVSVHWDGVSTTASGSSVQRQSLYDSNQKADWVLLPSTFGALNAGQSFLSIRSTNNNAVILSWSASTPLVLEETTNLTSGAWVPAPPGNPTPAIAVTGGAKFYRLRTP